MIDPGFEPGNRQSLADNVSTAPFELKDDVYLRIYILYFFTSVLIERIYLLALVLIQDTHHWESSDVTIVLQRLEDEVYLCIYIFYTSSQLY